MPSDRRRRIVVQDYPRVLAPDYVFRHKTDPAFDIGNIAHRHKKDIDHYTTDTFPLLINAEKQISEKHFPQIRFGKEWNP